MLRSEEFHPAGHFLVLTEPQKDNELVHLMQTHMIF
jgi:hypothetical protein